MLGWIVFENPDLEKKEWIVLAEDQKKVKKDFFDPENAEVKLKARISYWWLAIPL